MADGPGGEKTEKATPKRRQEARKEGQVARSVEINSAFSILVGFGIIVGFGPQIVQRLGDLITHSMLLAADVRTDPHVIRTLAANGLEAGLVVVAPFFVGMLVIGVLTNVAQIRFKVTPEVVKPRLKRINPISGFKQRFSPQQIVELAKNIVKLVVVGVPAGIVLWIDRDQLLTLTLTDVRHTAMMMGKTIVMLGLIVGGVYILIGILDYLWQRYRYEKQLRMTKYEVKQELRQQDMAPELKAQQRQRQREAARRRMLAEVPDADVVITNPTHFSVALAYDPDDGAPRVLAKGQDLVALRIREIADEHGVMRVENPPLARALYAQVEVGQFIPGELFAAVAEVLAFVYRHQKQRRNFWESNRNPLAPAEDATAQPQIEHA